MAHLKLSGNRILWITQLNDPGLYNYDPVQDARTFMLASDAWFLNNLDQPLEDADIGMIDAKDITLKILTKFNMSLTRKLSKYQEDALPIRLKQIHIMNAPTIIDKLFALIKPILKKETTDMIHIHVPNSETIFQYIRKDELPEDYGGTLPKMDEHMKNVMEVVHKHREQLINESLWRATIENKPKIKKESPVELPFRALAID